MTDYGWIRVSTGSQDARTQKTEILAVSPDAVMCTTDTKSASASKGEHKDAIWALIEGLRKGDRVIVTESSRLDRDPDMWAQMAVLVAIKARGAEVLAINDPGFGGNDKMGVILTGLKQMENAEKSLTVKAQTWRGVSTIMRNLGHHGPLPVFWQTRGVRHSKQAYCADADAVLDIYTRIADGESLNSVGRLHVHPVTGKTLYPATVKALVRFEANHTGVITCSYTHEGVTESWPHAVAPVVDSALWWRANKVLDKTKDEATAKRGGRPVGGLGTTDGAWLSGLLGCPECDGRLYINSGKTPSGNARTPVLRCGGTPRSRKACGRFKGIPAQPIIDVIAGRMAGDTSPILAFQRITGNAHELEELRASLARLQARLSTTPVSELPVMVAEITSMNDRIESFVIVDDDFDYAPAPAGQTVAGMWRGDDSVKRNMVRAIRDAWGMTLVNHERRWGVKIGTDVKDTGSESEIVDLGGGLCFRREAKAA
jgi:DNA invertase Pin-like site-specific DNA recombinase